MLQTLSANRRQRGSKWSPMALDDAPLLPRSALPASSRAMREVTGCMIFEEVGRDMKIDGELPCTWHALRD